MMNAWSKYPFIRIVIPFVLGIILYQERRLPGILFFIILGTWMAVLVVWNYFLPFPGFKRRWVIGFIMNIAIIGVSYGHSWVMDERYSPTHFMVHDSDSISLFSATIVDHPTERESSYRVILNVNTVGFNSIRQKLIKAEGKIICYIEKGAKAPEYGDVIVFSKTPLSSLPPGNPGEFDYANYLSHRGIFHTLYLKNDEYVFTGYNNGYVLKAWAINIRNKFLSILSNGKLEKEEMAVAAAMLTGDDDLLDSQQRQEYSNTGVIHILCVSGLHVGVIFLLAEAAFSMIRNRRFSKVIKPVFTLLIIWFYALLTGMAAPVLRASFMFSLILVGRSFQRQLQTLNTLGAAAFVLLFVDPCVLYNVGFQLSFSAVAGIVLFQKFIKKLWQPSNILLIKGWDLIAVSISAQVFTLPLILYYFGQFPVYFLIANLIAIPISGIIIYTGIAATILSFMPFLQRMVVLILSVELKILNGSVSYIEDLPGSVISQIFLSPLGVTLIFLILITFIVFLMRKEKVWLYFSLISLAGLSVLSAVRNYHLMTNELIVFHKMKGHTLISLVDGRKHMIVTDSIISANNYKCEYQIKGFSRLYGLRKPVFRNLQESDSKYSVPDFFNYKGRRIVIISGNCLLPDSTYGFKADYVLLRNNPKVNADQLNQCFPGTRILLDCTCYKGYKSKICESETAKKITWKDLEDGAVVVKF